MNKKELNHFRKILEGERKKLLKMAHEASRDRRKTDEDDLMDDIDLASSELDQSMVYRLRDRERNLLRKIEKTLQKIEDGTYGICESCGEPIGIKRLEARPVAELCISCKETQEKQEY